MPALLIIPITVAGIVWFCSKANSRLRLASGIYACLYALEVAFFHLTAFPYNRTSKTTDYALLFVTIGGAVMILPAISLVFATIIQKKRNENEPNK
jgi:hypothetical protein